MNIGRVHVSSEQKVEGWIFVRQSMLKSRLDYIDARFVKLDHNNAIHSDQSPTIVTFAPSMVCKSDWDGREDITLNISPCSHQSQRCTKIRLITPRKSECSTICTSRKGIRDNQVWSMLTKSSRECNAHLRTSLPHNSFDVESTHCKDLITWKLSFKKKLDVFKEHRISDEWQVCDGQKVVVFQRQNNVLYGETEQGECIVVPLECFETAEDNSAYDWARAHPFSWHRVSLTLKKLSTRVVVVDVIVHQSTPHRKPYTYFWSGFTRSDCEQFSCKFASSMCCKRYPYYKYKDNLRSTNRSYGETESAIVEWKNTTFVYTKLMDTAVKYCMAMANSNGGVIKFGIADNGDIEGVFIDLVGSCEQFAKKLITCLHKRDTLCNVKNWEKHVHVVFVPVVREDAPHNYQDNVERHIIDCMFVIELHVASTSLIHGEGSYNSPIVFCYSADHCFKAIQNANELQEYVTHTYVDESGIVSEKLAHQLRSWEDDGCEWVKHVMKFIDNAKCAFIEPRAGVVDEVMRSAQHGSIVWIYGSDGVIGGCGKTTLARHCATLLRGRYIRQVLLNVHATTRAINCDEVKRELVKEMGVRQKDGESLNDMYNRAFVRMKWLIVLDDVGSEQNVRALLPTCLGNSCIIATSRLLCGDSFATTVPLGKMEPTQASKLVRYLIRKGGLDDTSTKA